MLAASRGVPAVPKFARIALVLLPTAAFAVVAAVFLAPRWNDRPPSPLPPPDADTGRLVVVLVFDQMRGDYPQRWADLFTADGFKGIERDGVWYADAHLPYSCSATGPGHASIGTGRPPAVHGVIENEWYDRRRGATEQSIGGEKPYLRVPAAGEDNGLGFSPDQMLCEGLGDHLKKAKPDARVFSLALKDRAAAMMGGKYPDGVYAFDTDTGEFHTTSRYREQPHEWVTEFNASRAADKWFTKEWERLLPAEKYDAAAGPDDGPGETRYTKEENGKPVGYGPTFPHPMNIDGQPHPNKRYYARLESSPFGNELLAELAWECVLKEGLGTQGRTDLLFVGYSANDLIGHKWGPDSHEVLDVTRRADRLVKGTREALADRFGPGRWTLIVTADHGICPLPERWAKERPDAERFDPRAEFDAENMGKVLDGKFGEIGPDPRVWFADGGRTHYPHLYLNRAAVERHGVKADDVAKVLAKWAGNRPHAETAFTRAELVGPPAADPLIRRCQLGYHPDRGGDVYVVTKAYCLPTGTASLGTTHGTPHEYDTHVPLFAVGAGVPKLGRKDEPVSSLVLGPVICRALGIEPPEGLPETLPAGWGR